MRRDDAGPYSLETLRAQPVPRFFSTDQAVLRERYIAWFEAASGRKLYPMQVEMLLIDALSHAMSVLGEEAQATAEQHLVATASAAGLEALGPNRSTPRLPAAKARCTIRFSLPAPRAVKITVPAGTRVRAEEDGPVFHALTPAVLPIGALTADVIAEAEEAGEGANGFLAGQIATLMDPVSGVSAANLTTSAGGADIEDVEAYRLRLANAFERISTGGSRAWYREMAMGVSSALVDVAVIRPEPCYVDLYPLTRTGPAGPELQAQILATFNTATALDIRFGDEVALQASEAVAPAGVLTVRYRGADPSAAVLAAIAPILDDWRERHGATVIPGAIETAARAVAGVVDAQLAGIAFQALGQTQYFAATITVEPIDLDAPEEP